MHSPTSALLIIKADLKPIDCIGAAMRGEAKKTARGYALLRCHLNTSPTSRPDMSIELASIGKKGASTEYAELARSCEDSKHVTPQSISIITWKTI
jgi:hypothetical protein